MQSSLPDQRTSANGNEAAASPPFVSVVLAVRNEAGYIGNCLQAIAAQDYPHDRFEVLLVDGESTDGTLEEARAALVGCDLDVAFLTNPHRTTAGALNLGIRAARGEIVVRVDGHTLISPGFISANVRALQNSGADAVGGPITTAGSSEIGAAIAAAMSSSFGIGDASFRHEDAAEQETDSVPYGAYRREVFERIGLFAEDIDRGEDDELNYRLRNTGGRILLSPSIRSVFFCRESLPALALQYWRYGLAKAAVLQRHPSRLRPRHLVPSALVLTLVGGATLSLVDRRFAWLTALAGGAYAAAAIVAAKRLQATNPGTLRYLPAVFACIHLSAGAGLIAGFLRLLVRRKA
jgi:GT2 family glycosyltransferase